MAQRVPPEAMLELQQNFPTLTIGALDGDWAAYELQFLTAISRLPAVVCLVSGETCAPDPKQRGYLLHQIYGATHTCHTHTHSQERDRTDVYYIEGTSALEVAVLSES